MDMLKNVNLPDGTVIQAGYQTHGRGQRGTSWSSDARRNLTFSIVLRPSPFNANQLHLISFLSALAVHDTVSEILQQSQFDTRVKWPNDVLVNGRKIAGILIENNITGNDVNWVVVGIGMNINQTEMPTEKAISLANLSHQMFDIAFVLRRLCQHFEKRYLRLRQGRATDIVADYLACLHGLNETLPFQYMNEKRMLTIQGVGETGLLLLKAEDGSVITADVKELTWL